jgi:MraW methylase family
MHKLVYAVDRCVHGQADDKGVTAKDLVNGLMEADLARIFRRFGEERHANLAATAIVTQRAEKLFETTGTTRRSWVLESHQALCLWHHPHDSGACKLFGAGAGSSLRVYSGSS